MADKKEILNALLENTMELMMCHIEEDFTDRDIPLMLDSSDVELTDKDDEMLPKYWKEVKRRIRRHVSGLKSIKF